MMLRPSAILISAFLLGACGRIEATQKTSYPSRPVGHDLVRNLDQSCVADYDEAVNYFPERTTFSHATQLSVDYGKSWKRVAFRPTVATGDRLEYLLVQCGTPVPQHNADTVVITVPISRIVTGNPAMLGAADELGIVDRIAGMTQPDSATVPSVVERVAKGQIITAGGWTHGNIEPILALEPDVYLTFYSSYPQYDMHPRLRRLGVRPFPQADHLEPTPLGRAEWIKMLALLTNREGQANEVFAEIEADYRRIAGLISSEIERPLVMAGFASGRSIFELFGGRNQRAQLVRDAGGRFALEDDTFAGSWLITGFERIYLRGAEAPIWFGAPAGLKGVDAFVSSNPLHAWFRAVRERKVFTLDKGYKGLWAYRYVDQSMTKPHVLLAETIRVLHPKLAADAGLDGEDFFARSLP